MITEATSPNALCPDRSYSGRVGPSNRKRLPVLGAVSLLTALLTGCQSTVSDIDSTSAPQTPSAKIILNGLTTGGFLDVFDNGPVYDGGSVRRPQLVILPGNPARFSQFKPSDGGEYLYWHPNEPGSWIANAPAIVLTNTVDGYLSALAANMLTIPKVLEGGSEKDWNNSSNQFHWAHFRDGECVPGPSDTAAVRVTGTWQESLWVTEDLERNRRVKNSATEFQYSTIGSERQPARMLSRVQKVGTNTITWVKWLESPLFYAAMPPTNRGAFGIPDMHSWSPGQMILDRDLPMAEKRLLAARWVSDNSFLFGEYSRIGQIARKPLVWHRPPGECQITVLLSLGTQPGWTVCVARSHVFMAEPGKEYRFSLRSSGDMKNYLLISPH